MFKQGGPITFIVGVMTGVFGGFVLGVLLGKYVLQLFSLLYGIVDRRGSTEDERLKFELLLQ